MYKKTTRLKLFLAGMTTALLCVFGYGQHTHIASAANSEFPIVIKVNGSVIRMETPAIIHEGRVMVPLRSISDAIGAKVTWNQAGQTASASNSQHMIRYKVGVREAIRNGKSVELDVPPLLREGRVYIPLRFSAEGLGGRVTWNQANKEAIIYPKLTPHEAKAAVSETADQVIALLKNKDFEKLAQMTHSSGVTFSPYAYVNRQKDITLSKPMLAEGFDHDKIYRWGEYDGSGEPILMDFEAYYKEFVYTSDFAGAPWVGYNQSKSEGNSLNNASSQYPGAVIVEYYVEGTHPDYAGMDWESLRLTFQQEGDRWVLSGIIHDQWTI